MTRNSFNFPGKMIAGISLAVAFASPAAAQTNTADVVGTVTDTTGSIIPNATVNIVNIGTGAKQSTQANAAGEYTFSLLQVGTYSVRVEVSGFKAFLVAKLTLAAGDRARVDVPLELGAVTETVEVTGAAPALQTDTSTVGTLVDNTQVEELPLNGRNIINVVQVQAGITAGLGGSFGAGGKPDDRRQTSSYSANGQTDQANNNLIDGFDNNERMIGIIGVRPSPDAVEQVKIETGLYTAEVGRSSGGVVDLITKSGTNKMHGSAYEYFRNDILDARNYFALAGGRKPELRQNQFGGSIGGPIRKDKTFFFADYEGLRIVSGTTFVSTVPTLFERQNCNATIGCNLTDTMVTLRNGSQAPGPFLPGVALNPIGLAYFNLYPLPNLAGPVNNFSYSPNNIQKSNLFDARIDQHFSDRTTLFARYSFNNVNTNTPSPLPVVNGINPGGGTYQFNGDAAERQMQAGLVLTHTFNAKLLLELKAGYLRSIINSLPSNYGIPASQSLGLTGVNIGGISATQGLTSFILGGGYASLGDSAFEPEGEYDNSYQIAGSLIYNRGNQSIKIGGGLIRRQATNTQSQYPRGAGYILGAFSTSAIGDLVLGQATSIQRSTNLQPPSLRSWEPSFYIQDDWRATKALTLNLGVRYDIFTPYTAHNNAITNFDFSKNLIVGPNLPGVNHSSDTAGVATSYGNVSPRIGFALDLGHKTVMRGGYGISYFPDDFSLQSFLENAPNTASFHCGIITDSSPCTGPYAGFAGGNYLLGTLPVPTINLANATNPANYAGTTILAKSFSLRPTYVEQYTFGLEKDYAGNVFGASYVGSLGRHIVAYPNLNQAPYAGAATPIASLPTTIISTAVSGGVSAYNALQLTVERRLYKGLSANANYTFAHNLSNVSTNGEGVAPAIQNGDRFSCVGACRISTSPTAPTFVTGHSWESYDYGNSEIDVRHRVAVTLGYDLPFGKNLHGIEGALLKGFSTSALFFYQTGLPYTVENTTPVGGTSDGFTNSNDRPDVVGNINLAHPGVAKAFNTAAFVTQPAGLLGDEGKNILRSPRATSLNLSIFKTFTLREALKLQLRAESFNLTNTPSFSPPDPLLGDAQFGVISSTNNSIPARQLQFAAKILF